MKGTGSLEPFPFEFHSTVTRLSSSWKALASTSKDLKCFSTTAAAAIVAERIATTSHEEEEEEKGDAISRFWSEARFEKRPWTGGVSITYQIVDTLKSRSIIHSTCNAWNNFNFLIQDHCSILENNAAPSGYYSNCRRTELTMGSHNSINRLVKIWAS